MFTNLNSLACKVQRQEENQGDIYLHAYTEQFKKKIREEGYMP